jgi:predicted HD phosphohydrolase
MTGIEAIAGLFAGAGARDYLGEAVTIGVHMRQAGALAEAAGAPGALVAAALLHDVGHLRSETDSKHGDAGARWLSQWFGEAVTEPVRLHVAAKRYLCATEPGYFERLSAESVRTLALQGGPMTPAQAAAFGAAVRAGRGGGAPLGRRGQGPGRHAARVRTLRAATWRPGQVLGVRDRALTVTELRTLNATAPPR